MPGAVPFNRRLDGEICRLNTREVRYKEKMGKARNQLIEQLIQRDPTFKPPPGWFHPPPLGSMVDWLKNKQSNVSFGALDASHRPVAKIVNAE
jgi:hypothetical protein